MDRGTRQIRNKICVKCGKRETQPIYRARRLWLASPNTSPPLIDTTTSTLSARARLRASGRHQYNAVVTVPQNQAIMIECNSKLILPVKPNIVSDIRRISPAQLAEAKSPTLSKFFLV